MRRWYLGFCSILGLWCIPLHAADGDTAFLEALLEKGYLELVEKHPDFGGNPGLPGKLLNIKFKQACIKNGKGAADKLAKELETLFTEGEKLIDTKAPTPEAADLLYNYGQHHFDHGNFEGASDRFLAFSRMVNTVLDGSVSDAVRRRLTEKNYDVDLFLGRSHLERMKKIPDDRKEEKLAQADRAQEYLENYIWSLENYSTFAVKGYLPLCELWTYLGTQGRKDEADDFFKMLTADARAEEGLLPLLKVEVNPDSIKDIFEVALFLVRRGTTPADKQKSARDLLGRLKKLPLDPTPDYYMRHQLGTLLAQFCIDVSQEELPSKSGDTFKEEAKNLLKSIPSDPTKSPYGSEVQRLLSELGVEAPSSGGGMASLAKKALKQYQIKQFQKGLRILENLLSSTESATSTRALTWFYIGQGYYLDKRYLEACFAFERCHDTLPAWDGGQDLSAQRAYKMMYNSAKLFSNARAKTKPPEAQKKADRAFIQDVRLRFSKAYPQDKEALEATFYWGRDTFMSPWIDGYLNMSLEALRKIPEDHPVFAEAMFYRFKCAFKLFVGTPASDTKARDELFKLCVEESEKLFALPPDPAMDAKKLAGLRTRNAQTRCEVVQLNLLQEGRAKDAVMLLEGDFEKTQGPFLDADFKAQIPKWHIEGLYKMGTMDSLNKAMGIWESWQARALKDFEATRAKNPAAKLDSNIVKATQDLSNKGIKVWLKNNAGHADQAAFQKLNARLTTWIASNVKVTPLLLYQLMYTDDKAEQHQSVVDFASQYLEAANGPWTQGADAAEAVKYLGDVYRLQLKHLEALDTEEGWAQAAECQDAAFERGRAKTPPQNRPALLISKAQNLIKAGLKCPDTAKAKEKYFGAVVIQSLEIRKKYCASGDDRWWTTYILNLDALEGTREYERSFGILESLRLSVSDTQARRTWLLERLDKLEKLEPSLATRAALLRENIKKDAAELESVSPTPPAPDTPPETVTTDATAPKEPQ